MIYNIIMKDHITQSNDSSFYLKIISFKLINNYSNKNKINYLSSKTKTNIFFIQYIVLNIFYFL
jgi:hypothetical protein